jgi:hypothetical protein
MILNDIELYDGTLLHSRFAYKYFRKKTLPIGNIIAFRAPMVVEADGMIDNEDILNNDFIYSDDALNFLWEIPFMNDFGTVAYQRLFNTQMANILSTKYLKAPIEVDGDDLIVHKEFEQHGVILPKGKASVSIAYVNNGVAMSHTAINVTAGKRAPSFAYSTKLDDEQCDQFMRDIIDMFYATNDDIFLATTKTIIK